MAKKKIIVSRKKREEVAKLAESIAKQGPHFLNGARGAVPGERDGFGKRLVSVAPLSYELSSPMIYAATRGTSICKGRFDSKSVKGRILTAKDQPALKTYLFLQKKIEQTFGAAHILPFEINTIKRRDVFLTPRIVKGKKILGELCTGKMHFDCIGFVNYCFWKIVDSKWNRSFTGYVKDFEKPKKITEADLQPGDVVIRIKGEITGKNADGSDSFATTNHSGICYRTSNGALRVLNCTNGANGVVSSPYSSKTWPHRLRITHYWS